MANINDQDMNKMSLNEVNVQLIQALNKFQKAKFSAALGSLENPNVLKSYRKEIARLKTALTLKSKSV